MRVATFEEFASSFRTTEPLEYWSFALWALGDWSQSYVIIENQSGQRIAQVDILRAGETRTRPFTITSESCGRVCAIAAARKPP